MENYFRYRNTKVLLVGKIKGLTEVSKDTRKKLLKSNTPDSKTYFSYLEKTIGVDIRHHLLAYAFLRGKKYKDIENSFRLNNEPKPHKILQVIHSHLSSQYENSQFTIEKVEQWLNLPSTKNVTYIRSPEIKTQPIINKPTLLDKIKDFLK